MAAIVRDPAGASRERFDLIIIGGGIYGVMLALESVRRGLRPVVLEQNDFGAATSFNSLRTLHGGFRYLQSANMSRFMVSVQERSWFLRTFPKLTHPFPFLMPLYGDGLRKPEILRIALTMNHFLSWRRNQGLPLDRHIPWGGILGPEKVQKFFPDVDDQGLRGGAVWFDVCMPDSQRILMETLRWACGLGAVACNQVQVVGLRLNAGKVAGVEAVDKENGQKMDFTAKVVINAAGPWCRTLAKTYHQDVPTLFRPSLAWNVLLNRKPLSSHGLAVAPKKSGARTYFLLPWKGLLLAGTGHAPWNKDVDNPMPSQIQMEDFFADLNTAVPGLRLKRTDVLRVLSGLLPATQEGGCDLEDRPVILDHGRRQGPQGLFSVSGVKFTTARHVAEQTLRCVARSGRISVSVPVKAAADFPKTVDFPPLGAAREQWLEALRGLIADEAPLHLEDLFLRRTNLWHEPSFVLELAAATLDLFSWNDDQRKMEMRRLSQVLGVADTNATTGSKT